ncbi:MAG: ABC transporter ATP-binding protein [Ignavibacteriae bacterium]|nr:ABC transporter ATP-binding protein [Ignavibacteriota bacterium]NOG97956.1 ABC transporter ATP-binding protein [Ignavibacteriota bacterium]
MEILKTENLEKVYEDNGVPVHALKGINLTINKGDYLVIAGPSGSGKTTLLNLLGALDTPTKGKILFEGTDLAKKSRRELSEFRLQNLGFIFQAYNLIPVLTAIENIEFSMMLSGIPENERRERALSLMHELDIKELADKRPNEMSGGQQQRVAVARAIVNDPEVVLADEPTANLDSATGSVLLDLMEKMNKEKNITFIFSSHDKQVIDRAGILLKLKDGKIEK